MPWGDREDKQRQVGVDQDGKAESDYIVSGDAVHLDQNVEAILQESDAATKDQSKVSGVASSPKNQPQN